MNPLKKLYNWMGRQVHSPYATHLLAALFFVEAIFFVPVDPLLILYCLERRRLSWYYATIATCASVLGGIAAYGIGYAVWDLVGQRLVTFLFSPVQFAQAVSFYKNYESLAVLVAGFTPLPYKAITLSAGFCKLPLLPFTLCSCISRGARFFLLAGVIALWGDKIKVYIDRYFNLLVLLFTLLIIGTLWLIV